MENGEEIYSHRCRVRILGYHDTDDLKDEELPLAHILLPSNTTTVGGRSQTVQYQGGEIVIGFFFDGEDLSEFIKDNKAKSIETDIDILTGISDIDKTKKNLEAWKRKVKESIPKIIKKGDALRRQKKNVITCMMILNHMRKSLKSTKKD